MKTLHEAAQHEKSFADIDREPVSHQSNSDNGKTSGVLTKGFMLGCRSREKIGTLHTVAKYAVTIGRWPKSRQQLVRWPVVVQNYGNTLAR